MNSKKVLLIGWNPNSVDYNKYPGMNQEKLRSFLEGDMHRLNDEGYAAEMCYIDSEGSAEKRIRDILHKKTFDIIMVGAGVRKDDDCFYLFEKLVNVIHHSASKSKICFNTGPSDSVEAVKRCDLMY